MESPSDPAKIASVPLMVENGQERTANWVECPGTSIMNAIWLTNLLSQSLAKRALAGKSFKKVLAMVATLAGSCLCASAKLLSFALLAA